MKSNLLALLLGLAGVATGVQAQEEFVVSYDGFYDRLKVIEKGEFEFARVNFYLVDIATLAPCGIKSGKIVTETSEQPLNYTQEAQLLLPFSEKLDKDKAVIVVEPLDPQHDCQIKFQIESAYFTNTHLTKQRLYQLHHEFDELLSDLSGFFVSKLMGFLLPEQQGVKVTFASEPNLSAPGVTCEKQVCQFKVTDDWENDTARFNTLSEVVTVTPWIEK
ncbi:DUF2987 domain-containing protein [Pseudoalteromonas ardens]|uniref:DUF2987 domain-containing protein n=1 Tax=Pseudoalteromonas ardens TaxID=3048490 RepID=UPI0009E29E33|nr:DUF2987 domain-containing protein [Pseudoalteromonas sp. R96]MDK1311163.1 DUF2987 domain-containing protein [Pseudoalteromonas sp. R96]